MSSRFDSGADSVIILEPIEIVYIKELVYNKIYTSL